MKKPRIYDYRTTRAFIKAMDLYMAANNPKYSRRKLLKQAKISSPNALSLMLTGKRALNPKWFPGICRAFELNAGEKEYLEILLHYETARPGPAKSYLLKRLAELNRDDGGATLKKEDFLELLSIPYAWDVFFLCNIKGQNGKPSWFLERLGRGTTDEIQKAIDGLVRLNILQRSSNGTLSPQVQNLFAQHLTFSDILPTLKNFFIESLSHLERKQTPDDETWVHTVVIPKDRLSEVQEELKNAVHIIVRENSPPPYDGKLFRVLVHLYPVSK
ncbi:MAG: hypothetical protein BroJett040_03350 [Oligoflexia bacterium]|nr:MAG: hypothetical protein BroJett040_03350 [Oligoflexia bacterium]